MLKIRNILFLQFLFAFFVQTLQAQIVLPPILGDNAVLQQNSEVQLWGMGKKSKTVTIHTSWDGNTYTIQSDKKGYFSQSVKTPKAGGPYSIKFNDGKEKVLKNILIGEVWFCSGQSNMVMTMSGRPKEPILNSEEIIKDSYNEKIRVFTAKSLTASPSLSDDIGAWNMAKPMIIENTSALAYQFAQKLEEELNVPVGIIISAWGGTPIRAWMSKESLKGIEDKAPLVENKPAQNPSTLYNGMIAPYTSYSVRGVLWYQGETDRDRVEQYREMMPAMVKDWRQKFRDPDMPFYYVQIAPWMYRGDKVMTSPYFREMQYELSKVIPNSGIVVTADVGSSKTIHPSDKTSVAQRLLKIVLAKDYGYSDLKYLGPEVKASSVKGNRMLISFDNADGGLVLKANYTENFEIAGEDRVFHEAEARLVNEGVEVWSDQVSKPVAVRYGFKNFFHGNLFNKEGLPATPFRTDKWE